MAFTPYVLFRNLQLRGATFEERSVKRYVSELYDDGFLEKIEYENRQHLYIATDKAHKKFRDSETEQKKNNWLTDENWHSSILYDMVMLKKSNTRNVNKQQDTKWGCMEKPRAEVWVWVREKELVCL